MSSMAWQKVKMSLSDNSVQPLIATNPSLISADIRDGFVAIKGWTELSDKDILSFCQAIEDVGVKTLICTDISKDGLLGGTNMELYKSLREKLMIKLIASGGVTSIDEIKTLTMIGMDGAILGKALYAGSLTLADAIAAASVMQN